MLFTVKISSVTLSPENFCKKLKIFPVGLENFIFFVYNRKKTIKEGNPMLNFTTLLTEGSGSSTSGGTGIWGTIIMIVALFVVLYFFMIRPQKKQERKDAEMRGALAVGDEVTTIGGIIGKVVSIKGETFVLETTKDKTKIRFLKAAVRSVDVKAEDLAAAVIEKKAESTDAKADEKADAKAKKDDATEDKKAEEAAPVLDTPVETKPEDEAK